MISVSLSKNLNISGKHFPLAKLKNIWYIVHTYQKYNWAQNTVLWYSTDHICLIPFGASCLMKSLDRILLYISPSIPQLLFFASNVDVVLSRILWGYICICLNKHISFKRILEGTHAENSTKSEQSNFLLVMEKGITKCCGHIKSQGKGCGA